MDLASGEFIKFLFDDDLLDPFCIQFLVQALEETKSNNTRLAFSPRRMIDENNKFLGQLNLLNITGEPKLLKGSECITLMAANVKNFIGEFTTVLFRRDDCFGYNAHNHLFQLGGQAIHGLDDVSAFFNLAMLGNVIAHPATLSYWRHHAASNTTAAVNPNFIYAITDWEIVVNHALSGGYLNGETESRAFKGLLRDYRYWLPTFPQLQDDIARFERRLMEIAA